MKLKPLIAFYVTTALAFTCSAVSGALLKDPSDAFRSDTTLGFMRKIQAHKQPHEEIGKAADKAMKDLQRGPNYKSKVAQEATSDVAAEHEGKVSKAPEKAQPAKSGLNPFGQLHKAITDAGEDLQEDVMGEEEKKKGSNAQERAKKTEKQPSKKPEKAAEQPEEKEVVAVPGCKNSPKGWKDDKGNDCEDYAEGEFCTRHGGYGDAWLDEWGTFEDVASADNKSALQVCCVCGGGFREGSAPAAAAGSAPEAAAAPASAPASAPAAPAGPILGTKAGRPLQSQGYSGDLVAHEDGETMTDDWGREFGPKAGHRDIKTICKEHPDNEWCSLHGYNEEPKRSAASVKSAIVAFVMLWLACVRVA
jgi:hypothetical protein